VGEAPTAIQETRSGDAKNWKQVEPVRLNPKKLDVDAFNKMFEQTRIPDPDDDGYGDWLTNKTEVAASGQKFGGKFNRDVFNRTFEDEFKKRTAGTSITATVPQAITLAPGHGVEIGRGASDDYTAPAGGNMRYTDLRKAYTSENTFSNQVANVSVEDRNFAVYSDSRKKAPTALTNSELEAIQAAEQHQQRNEQKRAIRAAQEMTQADQYFQRMKQLVLTTDRR
jgi:hypothetical protein